MLHSAEVSPHPSRGCKHQTSAKRLELQSKDRLEIDDFKIDDDAFVSYPFANNFLVGLFGSYKKLNFRGLGIGSRLLAAFISEARKLGIREIWGSVQDGDVMQTPHLLDFYQKHGFSITEPDAECKGHAKWKIVMRLD